MPLFSYFLGVTSWMVKLLDRKFSGQAIGQLIFFISWFVQNWHKSPMSKLPPLEFFRILMISAIFSLVFKQNFSNFHFFFSSFSRGNSQSNQSCHFSLKIIQVLSVILFKTKEFWVGNTNSYTRNKKYVNLSRKLQFKMQITENFDDFSRILKSIVFLATKNSLLNVNNRMLQHIFSNIFFYK